MRNTKVIDPSLNKKITENERRMQSLFDIEINRSSKSRRNINKPSNSQKKMGFIHHKKNKSQDEIFAKTFNFDNNQISSFKGAFDNNFSKNLEPLDDDDDSMAFINRMEKRMKGKKNPKNEEEKNNKIFQSTFNNVYQKLKNKKNKKVYNRGQVNNIVERLYNNDYKYKKQPAEKEISTNDYSIRTNTNDIPMKKHQQVDPNYNVDDMIERFEEDMRRRNERMERKKKELIRNEKKIYTYKPQITERSRQIGNASNDSFLERQKKYNEKIKKKEERYKEDLKKEEEKKINENNILLNKNKKKEKKGENENENKYELKKSKEEVDKTIQSLYNWENKRKEKIEKKLKEKSGKAETEFDHIPKINKRSDSMANKSKKRKDEPDVFSRLSKEDKMVKERRQVLEDLYTPTFQPNTFLHNQKIKSNKINNDLDQLNKKKKKRYSESDSEEDDEEEDEEDEEEEDDNEDDDEEEDNFDYKQDPKIFTEDNVQDALRKAVLNKMKNLK